MGLAALETPIITLMLSSASIELFFRTYAGQVPLEWFVFVGSLAEEIISPIPAMLVTGITGSIALMQGDHIWHIGVLALLAATGKTLGAFVYYTIGDKLEDLLIRRVGKWIGVTHEEVESVGKRFTGHHLRDGGALFLIRTLPFLPTTPVSLACGIFKMDLRVFLGATFFGYTLKDTGYIAAGYFGLAALETAWRDIEMIKWISDGVILIVAIVAIGILYQHRHRGVHLFRWACRLFDRFSGS